MSLHPLSHFERLPTELVQQIASYLIRPYDHGEPPLYVQILGASECKEFLPLRLASRTIAAKVDYVFTRGFRTHIVQYSEKGIQRLLCLSKTPTRKRVRALLFVAARDMPATEIQTASDMVAVTGDELAKKLSKEADMKTTMLVKALNNFPLTLRVIRVAPSLNKNYPQEVLADSIRQHPPTVILYATLQSSCKIKGFNVGTINNREWGTCSGIGLHASLQFPRARHLETSLVNLSLTLSELQCK